MCSTTYTSWLWFQSEKALDQTSKISLKKRGKNDQREYPYCVGWDVAVEIVSIKKTWQLGLDQGLPSFNSYSRPQSDMMHNNPNLSRLCWVFLFSLNINFPSACCHGVPLWAVVSSGVKWNWVNNHRKKHKEYVMTNAAPFESGFPVSAVCIKNVSG